MRSFMILYLIVMFVLIFAFHYEKNDSKKLKKRRDAQLSDLFRENSIKKQLESRIVSKSKISKKISQEKLLMQAGLRVSYAEYVVIQFATAILIAIVFGYMMNNIGLAILFTIIGYLVPGQVVAFLRNKRLTKLDNQIGSFMQMIIARYQNSKDFAKSLKTTEKEFRGQEPIYSEIQKTNLEIELGTPVIKAVEAMGERTENKYMKRFAAYYKVAAETGTEEIRATLLNQAFIQYEEERAIKRELKKEIQGPLGEAYIMIGAVPAFALYQSLMSPDYIRFMTQTSMGKIGTTVIVGTLILIAWFANAKLGAPLD